MAVCLTLGCAAAAPGLAFAVAPTTTIATDPAAPGLSAWYTVAPLVTLSTTQDGTLHWSWDGDGAQSATALAFGLRSIGAASEGEHILSVWSANAAGETESPPISIWVRVDSGAPSQPGSIDATVTRDVGVRLTWTASEDPGSGLRDYAVYRKAGPPPFAPTDVVAYTSATTFLDVPPAFAGDYTYAVSAFDIAGNESALSELALGFSDFTPPLPPTNATAWRSAEGVARVSWTSAVDVGIGVQRYDVLRSLNGGAFQKVGSAGREDGSFTDGDPAVASATSVHYEIVTVDRVGQTSSPAGPVLMGVDSARPTTSATVLPVYSGSASIALVPADVGSGVARTSWRLDGVDGAGTLVRTDQLGDHTLEYWSVDNAGNEESPHNAASFAVVAAPTTTLMPVYRFYNLKKGVHFYTASAAEMANVRDHLYKTYRLEGVAYYLNTADPANNVPLYRFYNVKQGVHFYTASEAEMANVRDHLYNTYRLEGVAYYVSLTAAGATPVYRFYNTRMGVHFYTASEAEKNQVVAKLGAIYRLEGIGYYLAP
jgi:hypothetical protein